MKIPIELIIDDETWERLKILGVREKRKNLSVLVSQIFQMSMKFLDEDDLILLYVFGNRLLKKIEYKKEKSFLEEMALLFSQKWGEEVGKVMKNLNEVKKQ